MLMTAIILLALQGQSQIEDVKFQTSLANTARAELNLVTRLKNLRAATEKLPETWKASGFKGSEDKTVTKAYLLNEIENMELSAAERWSIIVENTALVDISHDKVDERAKAMRSKLSELPQAQVDLNLRLDAFNTKLKDGILLNLAMRLSN